MKIIKKVNKEKIEQLLKSSMPEAGFNLLKTINDPKLTEDLADLIQSVVRSKYFEEVSDQKEVDKGLEILNDLLPNLASLDMSCCYMKKVDISKFTNLTSLDLSYCDFLENVDGIDELKNLTSLDLKNSPLLTNLDVEKIKNLPNLDFDMDVVGLRDEIGLILPKVETGYFDEWYDTLDEFLDNDFDFQKGISEDGFFGKFILLLIDESDFYDQNYNFQGPVTARWRAGRGTPDEFKDASPYTVHRIDKETTGVLIVAKNRKYAQLFTSLFRIRKIHKSYLCICVGTLDKNKGTFIDELLYYEGSKRIKTKAITHFEVLDTNNNYSFLRLNPETGRKHQLRKQLLIHGCPILGDDKYRITDNHSKKNILMLHAHKINFSIAGLKYSFSAQLPITFKKTLKERYLKNF